MAKWMYTLDIVAEWEASNDDESLVYKTADAIARKLKAFSIEGDSALDDIIEEFEILALDPDSDYDSFNYAMQNLYDWADTPLDSEWNGKKNCWIETF